MLATIIRTSGSTPAAALSKMLVTGAGTRLFGTIGGGCVEGDVLRAAKELYRNDRAGLLSFHLNEDHPENGMLCGGTLDVLIEPLGKEHGELVATLQALREEGEDCLLATVLQDDACVAGKFVLRLVGDLGETDVVSAPSFLQVRALVPTITEELIEKSRRLHEATRFPFPGGELILEPIAGAPQLLIFGGGHISKYLSRIASVAGFRITVVDDRKEFANAERFPEASKTLAVEFADAFNHVTVTPGTFIVIVTRGHRCDEDVLRKAISTPAKYIGMIGSQRKVRQTYEHLIAEGVPAEKLQHVHAPIGLDIGAVTTEEIAVSIVAELIYVRRGETKPLGLKSDGMKSAFDQQHEMIPND